MSVLCRSIIGIPTFFPNSLVHRFASFRKRNFNSHSQKEVIFSKSKQHLSIKSTISVKVVADSISPNEDRITTFELTYPYFIHAQMMSHRSFSRNGASGRAIPIEDNIQCIRSNPAIPIQWGRNCRGMQSYEINNAPVYMSDVWTDLDPESAWLVAMERNMDIARRFHEAGYHKQIVNRLLIPYQMMKLVCTSTDYDNFFQLRCHEDAQPEIRTLAGLMRMALHYNKPQELVHDQWHLPYVDASEEHDLETAIKISASCCAQVSYRNNDTSIEKAERLYNRMINSEPIHASPFEHQARPISNFNERGVTHIDKYDRIWSGNFCGWIQYRHLL